ncbi:MAG: FAD-dependent oxidoreductase, partial [Acetobacteraceae bacterium]|nr:FAD-dependent oxidoreductase [Acetobacteraceae bacterium]
MQNTVAPRQHAALLDELRRLLPAVALGTADLALLQTDIFYVAEHPPLAVATPRDVEQVQQLVRAARRLGLSLAARGAGLSYSAGYIPGDERTVVVDMTAMRRITAINVEDRLVTVEPGVTWAALHEALAHVGLTTPFW